MTIGASFDYALAAAKTDEGWAFQRLFEDLAGPVAGTCASRER